VSNAGDQEGGKRVMEDEYYRSRLYRDMKMAQWNAPKIKEGGGKRVVKKG
jgi:hypothetical protein